MSDDLIQRIKTFAGKIQAEKILIDPYDGSFYANPTGSFSRSGRDLLIEAADTLASKDKALAEIRAEPPLHMRGIPSDAGRPGGHRSDYPGGSEQARSAGDHLGKRLARGNQAWKPDGRADWQEPVHDARRNSRDEGKMPRHAEPPRLYLRKDRGKSVWIIRDGGKDKRTGCAESERASAENRFAEYLAQKHTTRPAVGGKSDSISIAEVLRVYVMERAPAVNRPKLIADHVEGLTEFWATGWYRASRGRRAGISRHRGQRRQWRGMNWKRCEPP
jgi:hypothetical protein